LSKLRPKSKACPFSPAQRQVGREIFLVWFATDSIVIVMDTLQEFRRYRERMNSRILNAENIGIKRYFALDSRAYEKGALDTKTKEPLGLVASTVLRCNDCITYHVVRCVQEGVKHDEFFEALNIALVVGGSITIPHLRRAVETFDECKRKQSKGQSLKL
jgi:AhpD family alkylhydroperoxidase